MANIHERINLFRENTVINWHEHVWMTPEGKLNVKDAETLIESANKFGEDKLLCSVPILERFCPPEKFIRANDVTIDAMKRYPDIIMGMCFVNPGYGKEAVAEIQRCVEDYGMCGIKLYHQYFMDDPAQFPIIEKCIELDIPILMHAGKLYRNPESQPNLSDGTHFVEVAKRYPEANFIMAHVSGGGDWHWQLKSIAPYKNVVTDISGSVYDRGVVEESVKYLGADRVLFGSDGSTGMCIGKILAADISLEDKKTILEGTKYLKFLKRGAK